MLRAWCDVPQSDCNCALHEQLLPAVLHFSSLRRVSSLAVGRWKVQRPRGNQRNVLDPVSLVLNSRHGPVGDSPGVLVLAKFELNVGRQAGIQYWTYREVDHDRSPWYNLLKKKNFDRKKIRGEVVRSEKPLVNWNLVSKQEIPVYWRFLTSHRLTTDFFSELSHPIRSGICVFQKIRNTT